MKQIFLWIKHNWIPVLLILIIFFLVRQKYFGTSFTSSPVSYPSPGGIGMMDEIAVSSRSTKESSLIYPSQVAPTSDTNRLVVQDTNLSFVVKDVPKVIKDIENSAKSFGGFLVNSYLSRPEGAASGTIVVRVPEEKLSTAIETFKNMSVKVVSESIIGTDVTDQYVDIESRLEVLLKTKSKFEDIMDKAYNVNDLLNVQRELINLQAQIDSLKGQQKYFEQSAKLSKVTIYLSTDELALPYAPSDEWRPLVVFKQAARSLIGTLRGLGSVAIWLAVYSVILIPLWIIFRWLKKKFSHT